jgi:hypothetical protein
MIAWTENRKSEHSIRMTKFFREHPEVCRKISNTKTGKKRSDMKGNKFRLGLKPWNADRRDLPPSWCKGKKFTIEHREKLSMEKIRNPTNYWRGKERDEETKRKISNSLRGEKSLWWKGGLSKKNQSRFNGVEWKIIRSKVIKRDGNKCCLCGNTRRLHVHHKIPYRVVKSNEVENLITLCGRCHAKEDFEVR